MNDLQNIKEFIIIQMRIAKQLQQQNSDKAIITALYEGEIHGYNIMLDEINKIEGAINVE